MRFIELIHPASLKYFYLRADLVERVMPAPTAGHACVHLSTGLTIECANPPAQVRQQLEKALPLEPLKA
jgi:hypothetical protein